MAQPWKVLVYMAADNSLYAAAQMSLREITEASRSSEVETIVQFDGPSAQLSTRYRCDGGRREVIWEAPNDYTLDRGKRLSDFLMASVDHPQELKRILLVLWGHGAGLDHVYFFANANEDTTGGGAGDAGSSSAAGATAGSGPTGSAGASGTGAAASGGGSVSSGTAAAAGASAKSGGMVFAPHEIFNGANPNQYVDDVSVAEILEEFSQSMNRKIDVLGFDACMMSMAEIWHELRESTALAVASDLEVPDAGWPYGAILSDLGRYPGMDASALATMVISRYMEVSEAQAPGQTVSLTACNLGACGALADAMRGLVDEMKKVAGDGEARRKVFRARDASTTPEETTYIDLGQFMTELSESFPPESGIYQNCMHVLSVMSEYPYLIYNRSAGDDVPYRAYGVALYFPLSVAPTIEEVSQFAAQNNLATGKKFHAEADTKFPPVVGKFPPVVGKFPPVVGKFPPVVGKFPPVVGKFPPVVGKFPPVVGKFPPVVGKFPGAGGTTGEDPSPDAISGYEILWDRYQQLDFCKATGWADLLESLLDAGY